MKKNLIRVGVWVLAVMLAYGPLSFATAVAATAAGESAPDFTLQDASQGAFVTLNSYKGKQPVVLLFWTTWCPFCMKALKMLNAKYPELREQGLEVLAINVGESSSKAGAALRQHDLQFPVLLDETQNTVRSYELLGVPTYVLVDKEGNVVFKVNTYPEKQLEDFLKK